MRFLKQPGLSAMGALESHFLRRDQFHLLALNSLVSGRWEHRSLVHTSESQRDPRQVGGVNWVLEGWAERRPGWCQQEAGYFWVSMVPLGMD